MTRNNTNSIDEMKILYFESSKKNGNFLDLKEAFYSFQGEFKVFLVPCNEDEQKKEKVFLADFEQCLLEFSCVADSIALVAEGITQDRILNKVYSQKHSDRIYSYSTLLESLHEKMKSIEKSFEHLESAQVLCCNPPQAKNQAVAA